MQPPNRRQGRPRPPVKPRADRGPKALPSRRDQTRPGPAWRSSGSKENPGLPCPVAVNAIRSPRPRGRTWCVGGRPFAWELAELPKPGAPPAAGSVAQKTRGIVPWVNCENQIKLYSREFELRYQDIRPAHAHVALPRPRRCPIPRPAGQAPNLACIQASGGFYRPSPASVPIGITLPDPGKFA